MCPCLIQGVPVALTGHVLAYSMHRRSVQLESRNASHTVDSTLGMNLYRLDEMLFHCLLCVFFQIVSSLCLLLFFHVCKLALYFAVGALWMEFYILFLSSKDWIMYIINSSFIYIHTVHLKFCNLKQQTKLDVKRKKP